MNVCKKSLTHITHTSHSQGVKNSTNTSLSVSMTTLSKLEGSRLTTALGAFLLFLPVPAFELMKLMMSSAVRPPL